MGTLTLLLIAFPFNLIAVLFSFLTQGKLKQGVANNPKRILLTGGKMTKSLQLARSFYQAGHTVFLVETNKYWLSGHRTSQAVYKFYTVPAPEKNPEGYRQGLLDIVKKEGIDVFIPVCSPVSSYYDSTAKPLLTEAGCEVIHFDPDITAMLDNKYEFCKTAREIGLSAPKVFRFTSPEQVLDFDQRSSAGSVVSRRSTDDFQTDGSRYIIKSINYDSVRRLDLTKLPFEGMESYIKKLPITEENPWVMQEFIRGQEYCTHSTVRNGKIQLHCCSKSSPFQVNYEQEDNPEILAWVKQFVEALNLTGQISFDFIQTPDGTIYPVECNPRTHSAITMFHDHPDLADAYLGNHNIQAPIAPLPDSKPTYWLYHELWRLTEVRSFQDLKQWWAKISEGTDGIFRKDDPLPFLFVHHWQIPLLLLSNLKTLQDWIRIDFNIGKIVKLGGD